MHNAPKPKLEDLRTKAQLGRSSIIACVGAIAVGTMVYMPAELGQDPTGVGQILGLTEMGQIKQQLAKEAAEDAAKEAGGNTSNESSLMDNILGLFASPAHAEEAWKDEIKFTLTPGEATEIKATMDEGQTLTYKWVADGGQMNFDLHAHAGSKAVTYEKGRGKTSGEGEFTTPFAGDHGWFWRNRDKSDVTVTLQLRGDYSGIVRSK